jgi:hypothetical protein
MVLFNMGLPMIAPVMYLMGVALIPIVLIEAKNFLSTDDRFGRIR